MILAQIRYKSSRGQPNFLEFWVKIAKKMTLKVKVNDPNFRYQPIVPRDTCLVQISSSNMWLVIVQTM